MSPRRSGHGRSGVCGVRILYLRLLVVLRGRTQMTARSCASATGHGVSLRQRRRVSSRQVACPACAFRFLCARWHVALPDPGTPIGQGPRSSTPHGLSPRAHRAATNLPASAAGQLLSSSARRAAPEGILYLRQRCRLVHAIPEIIGMGQCISGHCTHHTRRMRRCQWSDRR